MPNGLRELARHWTARPILLRSLKTAAIVGCALNLINQGTAIFGPDSISWLHILLNYLVPYCVASYSAAQNQLAAQNSGAKVDSCDR
jgi:hypothetical protein